MNWGKGAAGHNFDFPWLEEPPARAASFSAPPGRRLVCGFEGAPQCPDRLLAEIQGIAVPGLKGFEGQDFSRDSLQVRFHSDCLVGPVCVLHVTIHHSERVIKQRKRARSARISSMR
jgi:hypothetical protein